MKRILILTLIAFAFSNILAQNSDSYSFSVTKKIPNLQVCDQGYTGTCWCFSMLGMIEAEMILNGVEDAPLLSEMFVVRKSYVDKAEKYIRMQTHVNFSQGGIFPDVLYALKHYGIMPYEAYTGKQDDTDDYDHSLMFGSLQNIVNSYADESVKKVSEKWVNRVDSVLDVHLGVTPQKFEYRGVEYTPVSFFNDYCKINPDDYINLTSFNHHPYYEYFALEIPDNWRWCDFYNVKPEELTAVIDSALAHNHTVAWASDISENYLDLRNGYSAYLPGFSYSGNRPKDIAALKKLSPEKQLAKAKSLTSPGTEISIDADLRQKMFDNRQTTDDHGMLIVGTVKDQNDNELYLVKNSWGLSFGVEGYFYVSKSFVQLKTTALAVHKSAMSAVPEFSQSK